MFNENKLSIYKDIIQYLMDSTKYSLQRIANLSNCPIAHLQMIYRHNRLPPESQVELNLLKLFLTVVDMELKGQWKSRVAM